MTTDTKQCPFCAETIKAEAVVCRFCGRDLVSPEAVKPISTTPTPTPAVKQSKPKNKVLTQIIGVIVLGCCGLFALSIIVSGGNSKKSEGSPSQTASNQNSSQPTVLSPTSQQPTSQPPTSQPLAPSIQEILATVEGMTDAQRNQYSESLKGSRVEGWRGTIDDVDEGEIFGGFTIYIDMVTDNFGAEVHIDVSKEVALSLNKGQEIVFSGDIKSVSDILGITVFIENVTIEPAK
jgi:hypothetical protein